MQTSIIFALLVIISLGLVSLTSYFFLRAGGIVEKLMESKDTKLSYLQDSSSKQSADIIEMGAIVNAMNQRIEETEAMLSRRMTSFETRFGKQSKKDEQRELQEMALREIRHLNH